MATTWMRDRFWRRALVWAALVALAATGCMSAYGKVKLDPGLREQFLTGQVPDAYQYFYNGRDNMPYAIIGIKPDYAFVAKFWTPVTPNTDAFKKMARDAWTTPDFDRAVAGTLLDPDGNDIGLWYSYYPWATVEMKGDKAVAIYSPYKPGSIFNEPY